MALTFQSGTIERVSSRPYNRRKELYGGAADRLEPDWDRNDVLTDGCGWPIIGGLETDGHFFQAGYRNQGQH